MKPIDYNDFRTAFDCTLPLLLRATNDKARLEQYKQLLAANELHSHSPAKHFCDPCKEYENYTVLQLLGEIFNKISEASYILNQLP